jgi:hypothetical protein
MLTGRTVFTRGFFRDSGLDFMTRIALGRAAHGASDAGEVLATVARVKDHATWGFNRNMQRGARIPSIARTLAFRSRPYRYKDWFDLYSKIREYALTPELAGQITTPVLVTDPEDEQFWPGQSEQLADMVGGPAELMHFTAEEGANFHCQPMARLLTDQRMFDWLATQLT